VCLFVSILFMLMHARYVFLSNLMFVSCFRFKFKVYVKN